MTVRSTLLRGAWSRPLLLALCAALVPLPVMAADASSPPNSSTLSPAAAPAPRLKAAVVRVVERELAAKPKPAARRSSQSDDLESSSFFKSKAGVLVLAAFAAGVGYAIYSTRHDRIHSPGKE